MYNASLAPFAAAFAFLNTAFSLPVTDLIPSLVTRNRESAPRLIQYVQTFHTINSEDDYLSLLPLLNRDTGITHVILAAMHINGPNGNITLNDDSPDSGVFDQTWAEVPTLQEAGIKVMMMVGGYAQGSYDGRLCSKAGDVQDEYYLGLESILKSYNLDGIDLDIEEVVPMACPKNLVKRIRQDFGEDFIITMAPVASDLTTQGRSAFGRFSYSKFDASNAGQMVNWYNGQYYSGFVRGSLEESYEAAISNGYSPERVVMGLVNSENDGSGFVGLDEILETVENLQDEYRNFGGVDGWEYFDAGSSDGLARPWMWTKRIGKVLFGDHSKRDITRRSRHPHHTPALPAGVAKLMEEGHDQIAAARAMRLAKGDEEAAKKILAQP